MFNVVKFAAWVVGFSVGANVTSYVLNKIDNVSRELASK